MVTEASQAGGSSDLAEGILGEWRSQGIDADSDEIARLEAEIEDLEDSL